MHNTDKMSKDCEIREGEVFLRKGKKARGAQEEHLRKSMGENKIR